MRSPFNLHAEPCVDTFRDLCSFEPLRPRRKDEQRLSNNDKQVGWYMKDERALSTLVGPTSESPCT